MHAYSFLIPQGKYLIIWLISILPGLNKLLYYP